MSPQALVDRLKSIAAEFSPAALASSLSAEDMVLTDAIARAGLPIDIFVLDTERLHADTLELIGEISRRYGIKVKVYRPDPAAVADYVRFHGRDAFYESIELRKRCCEIRKVEPLKRALAGKRAWITGQRREHAAGRAQLAEREFDRVHGLEKFNPLAAWGEADVWQYVHEHRVPYNRLYDQGYRSIGCAPCTRPVRPSEDLRAGRWWWESPETKECGIHVSNNKHLESPGFAKVELIR
jgi:phosphoadenosine phosphosulfate reductase